MRVFYYCAIFLAVGALSLSSFQVDAQCSFTNLNATYCTNDASFTLTGGTNYYGPGVTGNTFSPATAGAGTHTLVTSGPATTYTLLTTGTFSPVAGSGTSLVLPDEGQSGLINMGFTFNFFGTNYTQVRIGSNGVIGFGSPASLITGSNQTLPDATDPDNIIAAAWDDLDPTLGGTIEYFTTGTAPYRKFIVNYTNIQRKVSLTLVTVQIQLHEATNIIELHSTSVNFPGNVATQGIEGPDVAGVTDAYPVPGRNNTTWTATNDYKAFVPVCTNIRTVTVYAAPTITGQPAASQAVCEGTTANFSVTATGASLTYQWKKNGVDISGATSNTYSIPSPTAADAATYTVVVSGPCTISATSNPSVLTINELPEITSQPSDQTICAGQSATFTVNAGVTTGVTYQWRKGGVNIGGATSSSYTIAAAVAADAGIYDVVVSGTCTPSVTSTTATLTVDALPVITVQPAASQTVCEGTTANFSVTATGASLTYQWKKNGVDISGATSNTYSIASPTAADAATYTVVVGGACATSVTSNPSVLMINEQPEIITQPSDETVCAGQTATFTVDAGVTTGVSYQWRKGGVNIAGATSTSYAIPVAVAGDAGSYDVVITGTCTPSVTSTAAILTVNALPVITVQPAAAQAVCEGTAANFSVTATGVSLSYQWKKNGVDIGGATSNTFSIPSPAAADAATYVVVVSSPCGISVTSNASVLTINEQPEITGQPVNQTVCAGQSVTFTVNAGVTTSPTYQWRKGGSNIVGATSSSYTIPVTVAGDAGSYDVIVGGTCTPSVTSTAATLTINALPVITVQPVASQAVCEGSAANFSVTATGTALTYQWQKNGVNIGGATSNTYSIASTTTASAGTYTVIVSGACTPGVTSTASVLTINEQPEITGQPVNQTVCAGQSVTFTVNAGVTTSPTYQWRKGGSNIVGATSSSYTIPVTVAGDAGSYDVIVSGTCTPSVTSTAATLTINALPVITVQPVASQAVCEGSAANFSVTATGTALTYQWQKNGVNIGGATSNTYSIATTTTASAGTYTVIVSGTCTPGVTSTASVLTINEQPEITGQPTNQTVCAGQSVTFTVNAGVTTSPTYQWRKGGSNIIGANSSSYTIPVTAAGDAGSYDVIVGETCTPTATSTAATLTINASPVITVQPVASQAVCEGSAANFSVTATGTGLTYQWQKNGVNIGGATSNTYGIAATTTASAGTYTVIVSGTCTPSVTSTASVLTINEQPEITGQPVNQTVCAGQSVTFTVNAGVTTSPTYQWRKGGSNIVGATSSSYTIPVTVAGDAGSYDVIVSGTCTPSVTSTAATLTINALPVITVQPVASQAVCEGSAANFSVTATGTALTYQWQKNGVNIGGATSNTYSIAATTTASAGTYTVIVSGTCTPGVTSTASVLTINEQPEITGQPVNQTVCAGQSVTFTVNAGVTTSPTYQWRKGGTNIVGANSSSYTIPVTVAGDAGSYDVIVSGTCTPSVTSTAATLTINALPVITVQPVASQAVCEGSAANFSVTATGTGLTYQWQKNGVNIGGATSSTYSIAATTTASAGTYTVIVSGTCTPGVTSTASVLTINEQPEITSQPSNQTVCTGQSVTFTVNAGVTTGVSYQWRKGGSNIAGATSSSYTIPATVAGDAGSYDVIVSGTCTPSVTSTAATLTINALPVITVQPVASQAVCEGSAANFSVTATGTALTYQWKKNGIDIAGATSNTYSIATTATADAGTYTVVVGGTCLSGVTSTPSVLTISEQPEITSQPTNQTVCAGQSVTFTVNAGVTTGVSYQWRKGGSNIAGATSSSYTIPSTVAGDAGSYDVIVTGTCTPGVTSTAATLTINALPVITVQPVASQAVCEGSAANFSVTATGTGLTYQWQKNGVNIGGATSTTYSIAATTTASAGTYTVIVSGTCTPGVTSTASVLTINEQPEITGQPSNQTVCAGQSVTFTVNAGVTTSPTYQWRKGGSNIVGANSSSYTIPVTVAGDAGSYDVIVGGTCTPTVTSTAATLTINALPVITVQPLASQAVCEGSTANFSVTATGTALTYQWKKNGVDIAGATLNTYSIVATATADAGTYTVVVSGTCTPGVTSTASVLTINEQPEITSPPTNQTVCAGQSVTFTVNAGVTTGVFYQWRKGGSNIAGATSSSYTIPVTVASDAGSYDVVVSGTCTPSVTSTAATLTINALPVITAQPVASQAVCEGTAANFSVTATGTALAYQWKKNGVDIAGATSSTYSIALAASADAGTYTVVVSGTCTPGVTSTASVLTINERPEIITQPVSQTVCAGQPVTFTVNAGVTTGVTYQWRKGAANIVGATSSSYTIPATVAADAGNYSVIVSGTCTPSVTSAVATLTINVLPVIVFQPSSSTICEGGGTSFTVGAGATTGKTYQWQVSTNGGVTYSDLSDDAIYNGVITPTLFLNGVPLSYNTYLYRAIVRGTCSPPVFSNGALLTVQQYPAITLDPVNQAICENSNVTFTVNAIGTGLAYQWRENGVNITDGGVYSGATTASLVLTNVPVAFNARQYDVVVTGACDVVNSAVATLSVGRTPDVMAADQAICSGSTTNIAITNPNGVSGTTFSWTIQSVNNVSGALPGSGTVIAQTLTSFDGVNPGSVTYLIIPTAGICSGTPLAISVDVSPVPTVAASNQTICSGLSPNVVITNPNGVANTSFSWNVVTSTNITGAGPGTGAVINQVLTASDGVNVGSVTYQVTASANGCSTSTNVTVTVNPKPAITTPPASLIQDICSGTTLNIAPTSTIGGTTYTWSANVIGSLSGVPAFGGPAAAITDTPVNAGNTSSVIVYTITPNFGTCSGTAVVDVVTVRPLPTVSASPSPQIICSGSQTSVTLSNPNAVTGATFAWSVQSVSNVLNAAPGSGAVISQTLTSQDGVNPGTVTYLIWAIANGCSGPTSTVTVTVNPTPVMTNNPTSLSQQICSGDPFSFTPTSTIGSATYVWTSTVSGTISGATSGNGVINDPLINTGNTPGTVTYHITPYVGICAGNPIDLVVTVKPQPSATASSTTICSGDLATILITPGPVNVANTTFSWQAFPSVNVTGAADGNGSTISQVLSTTNASIGTVQYVITPAANGCNSGPTTTVTVTVNPFVTVNAGADFEVCEAVTMPMNIPLNGTIGGSATIGTWKMTAGAASGSISGNVTAFPSVTATYQAVAADVVRGYVDLYLETNDPDGTGPGGPCLQKSDPIRIFINARAYILPIADQIVCEPSVINLAGTLQGSATTGTWSAVSPVTGVLQASSLTGNVVTSSYMTVPNVDVNTTLVFRLTTNDPDGGGPCVAAVDDVNVQINLSAKVNAGPDFEICEDELADLNGSFSGSATSVTWTGSGGAFTPNANDPLADYTLTGTDIATGSVLLTLTTNDPAGVCPATSDDVLVKINPLPAPMIFGLAPAYAENDPPVFLNGIPATGPGYTGAFTGPGITAGTNIFNPANANLGFNTITYSVTNTITGCFNSTSRVVVVNELTALDFTVVGRKDDFGGHIYICPKSGDMELKGQPDVSKGNPPETGFVSLTPGLFIKTIAGKYYVDSDNPSLVPGEYLVEYTFKNDSNAISNLVKTVVVYGLPQASILTNNACVTDSVRFASLSDIPVNNPTNPGKINSYLWNFGNGLSSTDSATAIVYAVPQTYNVSLTATTDQGCASTANLSVDVGPVPHVNFEWTKICSGDATQFTDLSTGNIVEHSWAFDDGDVLNFGPTGATVPVDPTGRTTGTYNDPNHKYASANTYSVTHGVRTNVGCVKDTTIQVYILSYNQPILANGYATDFEIGPGSWINIDDGNPSSWVFGTPTGANINAAYSGTNAWWTGANTDNTRNYFSTYYENEQSSVWSPCIDLSGLQRPMISIRYWSDVDKNFDGAVLQYSDDGGVSWSPVGSNSGEGINWYNGSNLSGEPGGEDNFGWTDTTGGWRDARFNLDALPRDTVVFRIAFGSNPDNPSGTTLNGFAFDNVFIGEKNRNVLVEHFTNDASQASNQADNYLDTFLKEDFIKLQYHIAYPADDQINLDNPDDLEPRTLLYGVSQPPVTIMDGITGPYYNKVNFDGSYAYISDEELDRRSLEDPLFDLSIDTSVDGGVPDVLQANVSITYHDTLNVPVTAPIIVHAVLVETGVNFNKNSMRKLLWGPEGHVITQPMLAGVPFQEVVPINYSVQVPIVNGDSLFIIAFAQEKSTRRILQSTIVKAPYKVSAAPVAVPDNPAVAELKGLSIYPNPASHQINLYLGDKLNRSYTWKIVDQRGVTVLQGDLERDLTHPQSIDISQIANGIYFMAIQTGDKSLVYSKIAVMNSN